MNTMQHQLDEIEPLTKPVALKRAAKPRINRVGYQTWTDDNLVVESHHNDIRYYTSRWDALCPYIDVSEDMLERAPKPFIVYALPPDCAYGVPINDQYGLVDTQSEEFWSEPRRARKFREYDKLFRHFTYTEDVIPGSSLTVEDVYAMGSEHFASCEIDPREVAGFVDYIQTLDVLLLRVYAPDGELVLTEVAIILPDYDQVYGSFCQWNRAYKNRSPGMYACLLASRWTQRNGLRYYNLGPVGDYDYKSLFVTTHEPIYSLALTDPEHPLALDPTSPLHTDFQIEHWNQVYRTTNLPKRRVNLR
jgi:hypothetical protein